MQPDQKKKGVFRRLLQYLRPHLASLLLALFLVLVITVCELLRPILIGNAVDAITDGCEFRSLIPGFVLYLVLLSGGCLCSMGQTWILQKMGQDVIYHLRMELFEHVHSLSLRFFDITPVGRIVTRITNDTESLNELFSTVLVNMIKNVVMILGLACVMLILQWKLALLSFLLLPVVFAAARLFTKLYRTTHRITRTKVSALNTFLSEHLSGMKLIQIFHREAEKNSEFSQRSEDLFQSNYREIIVYGTFQPLIYWISILALAMILGVGGKLVMNEVISVGTLYIFSNYIKSFYSPIQSLSDQFGTLQSALAAGEKIFTLLDEEPAVLPPKSPVLPETLQDRLSLDARHGAPGPDDRQIKCGRIEFDHVWFSYDSEEWVLKDVSFVIEPGETAAFVGATGAGKSSILNLIGRYYDVQKGRITVDGVDVRDMDPTVLRRMIGQVQQDVFLFTGTIRDNIRLRSDISDETIRQAACFVNADGFISALERGYEEAVAERGATLSAGQRQLLSFARTLAHDPAVLVMDEATANIDTETETLIQDALSRLMKDRTTIVVAHRLSTIQHADRIMVMHHGRLCEQGTHQELLAQKGLYYKLYSLQR